MQGSRKEGGKAAIILRNDSDFHLRESEEGKSATKMPPTDRISDFSGRANFRPFKHHFNLASGPKDQRRTRAHDLQSETEEPLPR